MIRYLDLSFNKIKHIKNIDQLTNLTDLFFVSNRISKIENLDTLVKLDNLELGANKIRVGWKHMQHQHWNLYCFR